jgi:electron transfer flavoprotein alpha subunit
MKNPARDVDLRSARVIVACGAGVKNGEDFALVKDLADCLGAQIAGTRPDVDRGFITREQMIGQTGVSVRPEVYIAIGISGSSQPPSSPSPITLSSATCGRSSRA